LLGVAFEVVVPDVKEMDRGNPADVAVENARLKALAIDEPDALVIACDTLVALDDRIFGKPEDEAQAREFLGALAGEKHQVHSGLALVGKGGMRTAHVVTQVEFRPIEVELMDSYLATGEWEGRAGGCDIQGAGSALVKRIDGDYLNVVGLPTDKLLELEPGLLTDFARPERESKRPERDKKQH
jgi:septum formation protein